MKRFFLLLALCGPLAAAPLHDRTGERLPLEEREFAQSLSLKYRRIFCGRFNAEQRKAAITLALSEISPDAAVLLVMEEIGLGLSVKKRAE